MIPDAPESPETPPIPRAIGILPGMAAIALFLLFISMFTAFKVMHTGTVSSQAARYSILAVCSMVVLGVFGLLRLRRWGWALVCGGCVVGSLGNILAFHGTHIGGYLIQGLFSLMFFLYLIRPQIRERLRS